MILIGGAFLVASLAGQTPQQDSLQDPAPAIRRLAATSQLAAQEYRLGVAGGKVVAPEEVAEAKLFLGETRRSAELLPDPARRETLRQGSAVQEMLDQAASPDTVDARVRQMVHGLSGRFGVAVDDVPAQVPALARGATVYRTNCAGCHGQSGRGDGPMAVGLDPKPADLADLSALQTASPLDFYRRISIGVVGTSMPAFEARLAPEDRWAVALYASLLRLPRPAGAVPASLQQVITTGKMSDQQVLQALGDLGRAPGDLAQLAAVRSFQPDQAAGVNAQIFSKVRAQIDSTYALARRGDTSASSRAFDAYMTFEQVERSVQTKNPGLAAEVKSAFASLRTRVAGGATVSELDRIRRQLDGGLENAERILADRLSPTNLFVQSFVILLREGLEALLLVGALLTFLGKMGAAHRKRDIHIGVAAAVVASLFTAVAVETIFELSPSKREALEGATMVVATGVLFYVSYWLLSKMEVVKWNHFVKSKVQDALTSGSGLALASAAFLAVYREGFETVLFYKALFVTGGSPAATMPIIAGILLGSLIMVAVYLGINRFGLRLPLKPFFGVTSAFLYYMAFVFAGKGIAELQEGGLLPTTIVTWAPRIPALGIYPTLESIVAQSVLVVLLVVALVWTFVLEPRRMARVSGHQPVSKPPRQAAPVASAATAPNA